MVVLFILLIIVGAACWY
ncbi:YjcZ family sporulation protein [Bacillus sp. EB600]|nr:YjcZ family sporulation protein [Bacillus sp. EB600]